MQLKCNLSKPSSFIAGGHAEKVLAALLECGSDSVKQFARQQLEVSAAVLHALALPLSYAPVLPLPSCAAASMGWLSEHEFAASPVPRK